MTAAAFAAAAADFTASASCSSARQGIGDILKGGQNRAAILFRCLSIESLRGALLMQQRAALKNGGGSGRAQAPEAGARREQLIHGGGRAAGIRRQYDIRQSIRDGNADLGAGIVQVRFGLQHVRALFDERGGQTDRQFLRQLQTRKIELFRRLLAWKSAGEHGQEVAQLSQLLEQRRQRGLDLRQLRLLRGNVEPAGIALGELVLQDLDGVGIAVDELAGRINLHLQ